MTAREPGINTGNQQLDALLGPEVLTLRISGQPAFAGMSADQRLDRARVFLEW
jgi:hypothetical protein